MGSNKANIIIIGIILLVALIGFFGYRKIESLTKQNIKLENKLEQTTIKLNDEIERSNKIEEVTQRLDASDIKRQKQLRTFEGKLGQLAKDDIQIGKVIDTIIPDDALRDLQSFQKLGIK